jgi:hypothetical protein
MRDDGRFRTKGGKGADLGEGVWWKVWLREVVIFLGCLVVGCGGYWVWWEGTECFRSILQTRGSYATVLHDSCFWLFFLSFFYGYEFYPSNERTSGKREL